MANRNRGEVSFTAGDKTYTLSFSINALCELEDAMGETVTTIGQKFSTGDISMRDLRKLLWAGLTENHDVDLRDAGNIATEVGLEAILSKLEEAFSNAFPEAEDDAGKKTKASRG